MEFVKKRNMFQFSGDIQEIVAEYFTNFDMNRSWEILNRQKMLWRRVDIAMLVFFGGGSLLIFFIIIYNFVIHPELFKYYEEDTE